MKINFCEIKFNKLTKMWYCVIKTPLINQFLENRSKRNIINQSSKLCHEYELTLYIYDKYDKLIVKKQYKK